MAAKVKTTGKRRVFVYGTLKKGHPNHKAYLKEAKFLGRCVLRGKYSMLDITYYPGLIRLDGSPDAPTRSIVGEVYVVDQDTLDALDVLEGNGYHYTRSKVQTPWKNAWCYFLPPESKRRFKEIESGQWRPTKQEAAWVNEQKGA